MFVTFSNIVLVYLNLLEFDQVNGDWVDMYDMKKEQLLVKQFVNLPIPTSFFQLDINIQKGSHHEDVQSKTLDHWEICMRSLRNLMTAYKKFFESAQ